MTKEDRELLLQYLCACIPYGIIILHEGWNYEWDDSFSTVERVVGIDENFIYTKVIDTHNGEEYRKDKHSIDLFDDKLYLRPMSFMTEEEKKELSKKYNWRINGVIQIRHHADGYWDDDTECSAEDYLWLFDWLNAHHFDYRGLIPRGLAIEVTKENNPYKL